VDLVGTRNPEAPLAAVEELLKSDDIDCVISLGIVGRIEFLRLMNRSTKEVDKTIPPGFLDQTETILRGYEEKYIATTAELMERYEKPVIGVSLVKTSGGAVRPVAGRRYSLSFMNRLKALFMSWPRWWSIRASWEGSRQNTADSTQHNGREPQLQEFLAFHSVFCPLSSVYCPLVFQL